MQSPQFFPQRWRRRAKKIPFSIIYWHCSRSHLSGIHGVTSGKMHRPKEVTGGKISTEKNKNKKMTKKPKHTTDIFVCFYLVQFFATSNELSFLFVPWRSFSPRSLSGILREGQCSFSESFISSSWWCSTLSLSLVDGMTKTEKKKKLEQQPFWVAHQNEAEVVCSNCRKVNQGSREWRRPEVRK